VTPPQTVERVSTPDRAIPDNNSQGIVDTISVAEAMTIANLKVGVDIVHSYRGDLRVTLATPWGAVVELKAKGSGGNAHDLKLSYDETNLPALAALRGLSAQGDWRLMVQDLAPADVGRLNRWSLGFSAVSAVAATIDLKESPGAAIPDFPAPALERTLQASGAIQVGSVEVTVDIAHSWIGDLRVSLRSPAGTEVVLHDGTGGSDHNPARTYTAATTPALATLAGQAAAGAWRLRVADQAAQDVGKLNQWRVLIKPAQT
jgi:subtilisin-like proprotein convertase family protein